MPHQQVKNGTLLKFLKDYWFVVAVITAISTGAITWDRVKSQTEINRLEIEKQQISVEANATALRLLNEKYIEDITYIKTTLKELESR